MNQNKLFQESRTRTEQLKCRQKEKERRKREADRKQHDRRCFKIGELACKYFPELMKLQPRNTKDKSADGFDEFEQFLSFLADNESLLETIKGLADKYGKG